MGRTATFIMILVLAGCDGPFFYFAGGAFKGTEGRLTADAVPAESGLIQLETRPAEPYSVNLYMVVIDGAVYIDPAEDRTWYQNLKADPNVRVRFDGDDVIYPARAERVTDPALVAQFEPDRIVMRLVPR